jgi:hypothetical protein
MGESVSAYQDLKPLAQAYRENGDKVPDPATIEDDALRAQAQAVHAIIAGIKAGIRRDTPVVVWHAFTNAEFNVVAGYDDGTGEFMGWGPHNWNWQDAAYARAPQGRMVEAADIGGVPSAIVLAAAPTRLDTREAEAAALREAVRHARCQDPVFTIGAGADCWCMLEGIAAYTRWASDWENPGKVRTLGDSYCIAVYSMTHGTAGPFLRRIASGYADATEELEQAAASFDAEAKLLEEGRSLLGWNTPEGPDPERNREAAALLAEARDRYAGGIAAIERALEKTQGGKPCRSQTSSAR